MEATTWSPAQRNIAKGIGAVFVVSTVVLLALTILHGSKVYRVVPWGHKTSIGVGGALTLASSAVCITIFYKLWQQSKQSPDRQPPEPALNPHPASDLEIPSRPSSEPVDTTGTAADSREEESTTVEASSSVTTETTSSASPSTHAEGDEKLAIDYGYTDTLQKLYGTTSQRYMEQLVSEMQSIFKNPKYVINSDLNLIVERGSSSPCKEKDEKETLSQLKTFKKRKSKTPECLLLLKKWLFHEAFVGQCWIVANFILSCKDVDPNWSIQKPVGKEPSALSAESLLCAEQTSALSEATKANRQELIEKLSSPGK